MPKTDRHSIKVTVGCQGNKCLQSHKAVEEVVPAWWWALKGLLIKKFNKNCSYRGGFCSSACVWISPTNLTVFVFRLFGCCKPDLTLVLCGGISLFFFYMPQQAAGHVKAPLAIFHLIIIWTSQCGPGTCSLLLWPQLTRKLLFNISGMELRPLLAGQYQLTAMGLWEITAVDARKRDL